MFAQFKEAPGHLREPSGMKFGFKNSARGMLATIIISVRVLIIHMVITIDIVVVNVASRCGFTSQYEGLQELWVSYKNEDLVVIGVPTNNFKQEPGTNSDIKKFCTNKY